jgi:hypothetical protein
MAGSPLISLPPSPASPVGSVLSGDGWWPDMDCTAARDAMRVPEYVTQSRLIAALEGASLMITKDLMGWQDDLATAGAASLETVTAAQLAMLKNTISPADRYNSRGGFRHYCLPHPTYTPRQIAWLLAQTGGQSRLIALYTRAVRYAAMAEIADQYRDLATTAAGQPRVQAMELVGADYSRMSIEAVRDMLGTPHISVELI